MAQDLVEIEEWNEYGELKQNVKMYWDERTIPPISQKPATPPPRKPLAAVAPVPRPAAAPPSVEETGRSKKEDSVKGESSSASSARKVVMPIHSIADEAAQRAKTLRLQSLREKVYGKKEDEEEAKDHGDSKIEKERKPPLSPLPSALLEPPKSPPVSDSKITLLQSPTTATWKAHSSTEELHDVLQSPNSTSWQPTHVDPPITSLHGSKVENVSEEDIEAIERAETIKEEPEAEEEAEKEEKEEIRRRSLEITKK